MWFDDRGNYQYKVHADPDSPSSRFRQQEELRRLEQEASQLSVGGGRRQQLRFEPSSASSRSNRDLDGTPAAASRRRFPPLQRASPPDNEYLAQHQTQSETAESALGDRFDQQHSATDPLPPPLESLFQSLPHLSSSFRCSDADAMVLLAALSRSSYSHGGGGGSVGHLEDRLSIVEAENRALISRLEARTEECDKIKDDLGEARQKLRAVQQQAQQSSQLLSQRRDEVRKQLILEEGRTQKLQQQNKVLAQELDKMKQRVHSLMQR